MNEMKYDDAFVMRFIVHCMVMKQIKIDLIDHTFEDKKLSVRSIWKRSGVPVHVHFVTIMTINRIAQIQLKFSTSQNRNRPKLVRIKQFMRNKMSN